MALMQSGAVLMAPERFAQLGALHIRVRRGHVMADALHQLHAHADELRKPLKVTFLGGERGDIEEEAVDEGALVVLHLHAGAPHL